MATLTIRNLDDHIVERLKAQAREHNRSLEAEVRTLLAEATERPSRKDFIALADRIATMTPGGSEQTDSTEIVRRFRDSR